MSIGDALNIPSREDIHVMGFHVTEVAAALKAHGAGHVSFEQALMIMVVTLVETRTKLFKAYNALLQTQPPKTPNADERKRLIGELLRSFLSGEFPGSDQYFGGLCFSAGKYDMWEMSGDDVERHIESFTNWYTQRSQEAPNGPE